MSFSVVYTASPGNYGDFSVQFTNFSLLYVYDESDRVEPYVNYTLVDSNLYSMSISQREFASSKQYNVRVNNVVLTTRSSLFLAMVSLRSLDISDCVFQQSTEYISNLIEVNTFVLDGPAPLSFYTDTLQMMYNYNGAQFEFVEDTYVRKDFRTASCVRIANNLFVNNINAVGMLMINEQGGLHEHANYFHNVSIVNNSFVNNLVYGWLVAYINQMKVKYVQVEGNLFVKNTLDSLYNYHPEQAYSVPYTMKDYTLHCPYNTYVRVQARFSCLISLLTTSEFEVSESHVSLVANLFLLNRIIGTSNICLFSKYSDCSAGVNSSVTVSPVRVNNNAFLGTHITNSTSANYVYPPLLYKFVEVFGLEDFFDLSHNWWNTLQPVEVSARLESYANVNQYGSLYQSERHMLTATPDMFGLLSRLCSSEWVEYEKKCFFPIASSLDYVTAQQVCANLNASLAQNSSELVSFANSTSLLRTSGLWLRNTTTCYTFMSQCGPTNKFVCEQDAVYIPPTEVPSCGDGLQTWVMPKYRP